jgi:hypothetical protein
MQLLGGSTEASNLEALRCEVQVNHAAALLSSYHGVVQPVV